MNAKFLLLGVLLAGALATGSSAQVSHYNPGPSQSCTILAQSSVPSTHTGDTTETTLATTAIPAGAMGANGWVGIKARWSFTGTGGVRTTKIKFGGGSVWSSTIAATVTAYQHNAEVSNRGATNSQYVMVEVLNSAGSSQLVPTALTIDTTAATTILINGVLAATADSITLDSYRVVLCPKA